MVVREKAAVGSPDISDDFLFINKAYPGIIELKLKPNAVDVPVLISQNKFLDNKKGTFNKIIFNYNTYLVSSVLFF